MPIFEITNDEIREIQETTFENEAVKERTDLQRLLRSNISAIAPGCFVLSEEFSNWTDAKRRIDLLCLDSDANLVVVELKRTEDGGHAELQAIRYAAMVSVMTFEDAVRTHAAYLKKLNKDAEEAEKAILQFLNWSETNKGNFAKDVRMVLVAADFSKEITGTALWLWHRGINIQCVRMKPYKVAGSMLVDVQQIIPLPEAADYQIQLRRKEEEERQTKNDGIKLTNFRFSMIGAAPGTMLVHSTNENETCEVYDDRRVKFRGQVMSIGQSAGIVLKEHNLSDSVAGTHYWGTRKDGIWYSLAKLRADAEETC